MEQADKDRFFVAALDGDVGTIKSMLASKPELRSATFAGSNALHLAAMNGHVDTVKALLSGAPELANAVDPQGQTALHIAASDGHTNLVAFLLEAHPELLLRRSNDGYTALHSAIGGGYSEPTRMLLKASPQLVHMASDYGTTALPLDLAKSVMNGMRSVGDTDPGYAENVRILEQQLSSPPPTDLKATDLSRRNSKVAASPAFVGTASPLERWNNGATSDEDGTESAKSDLLSRNKWGITGAALGLMIGFLAGGPLGAILATVLGYFAGHMGGDQKEGAAEDNLVPASLPSENGPKSPASANQCEAQQANQQASSLAIDDEVLNRLGRSGIVHDATFAQGNGDLVSAAPTTGPISNGRGPLHPRGLG